MAVNEVLRWSVKQILRPSLIINTRQRSQGDRKTASQVKEETSSFCSSKSRQTHLIRRLFPSLSLSLSLIFCFPSPYYGISDFSSCPCVHSPATLVSDETGKFTTGVIFHEPKISPCCSPPRSKSL